MYDPKKFKTTTPTAVVGLGGGAVSIAVALQRGISNHLISGGFFADVLHELKRWGLPVDHPGFFPISSPANASDLVRALAELDIDTALPADAPKVLRRAAHYAKSMLSFYASRRFGTVDVDMETGNAQLPILGALSAIYVLIVNYHAFSDQIRQAILEPTWQACDGAPRSIQMLEIGTRMGGTGGGGLPLISECVIEMLRAYYGAEVHLSRTVVTADPLMSYSGLGELGEYVIRNGMLGLLQNLSWLLEPNLEYQSRTVRYYTLPTEIGTDADVRASLMQQVFSAVTSPEMAAAIDVLVSNTAGSNPLARMQLIRPYFFDNTLSTEIMIPSAAQRVLNDLVPAPTAPPTITPEVRVTSQRGFTIQQLEDLIWEQDAPAPVFIQSQVNREFEVSVTIPQTDAFMDRLVTHSSIADVLRYVSDYEALIVALEQHIRNTQLAKSPHLVDGQPPSTHVEDLYQDVFSSPVKKQLWHFNTRERGVVINEMLDTVERLLWPHQRYVAEQQALQEALVSAKERVQRHFESQKATRVYRQMQEHLVVFAHGPKGLAETRGVADYIEERTLTTYYEAFVDAVDEPDSLRDLLLRMIIRPSERGIAHMLGLDFTTLDATAIVRRLRRPKIDSPHWGGQRTGKRFVRIAFPYIEPALCDEVNRLADGEFEVIPVSITTDVIGVVGLDVGIPTRISDIFSPPMLQRLRMALQGVQWIEGLPAYTRLTKHMLDIVNDGVYDPTQEKVRHGLNLQDGRRLLLPAMVQDLSDHDASFCSLTDRF